MSAGQKGPALRIDRLDVDGYSVRVAVRPGLGTPLLIFNGVGGNLELLSPFIQAVPGMEVVVFDLPGLGGSGAVHRPYRLRKMARLAAAIVTRLGYGEVDVLGVSWGGALAQEFAHRYPARCRKLVLCATAAGAGAMIPASPRVLVKMFSPRRYHDPAYLERNAGDLYGGRFRTDADLVHRHAARVRWPSTTGYWLQILALTGWSSLPWLWRLQKPTLVISGMDDPICPPINGRILARCIPGARLHIVDEGHLFLVAAPERSAKLVRDFLES